MTQNASAVTRQRARRHATNPAAVCYRRPMRSLLILAASLALFACGDDDPSGTGGSGGSGAGTTSAGGSGGTGGSTSATGGGGQGGDGGQGGGAAADTWNSYAMGFFDTYCVECHTAGDPEGRDYTLYAEVVEEAAAIRCGVTPAALPECTGFPPPAQFPVGNGPMPGDDERQRIVDWIDAGAPE